MEYHIEMLLTRKINVVITVQLTQALSRDKSVFSSISRDIMTFT